MANFPQLLKLDCFPMEKIWGGANLARLKNLPERKIGETWEVSTLPEGPSAFQGQRLQDYIGQERRAFWGETGELTYLIKFIDTSDFLSIQVHPDDAFAQKHENSSGKTECWIVLAAEPGAGIFLGLKEGTTKEEYADRIYRQENVSDCLHFYQVAKGDFFFVPAGTVHSIGKGVLLVEIQQSSGITYRVWDWNRLDDQGRPRALHVQKALQVINFAKEGNNPDYFQVKRNVFSPAHSTLLPLAHHPQFHVSSCALPTGTQLKIDLTSSTRASSIVCTAGVLWVQRGQEKLRLREMESLVVPFAGHQELVLTSERLAEFVFVR